MGQRSQIYVRYNNKDKKGLIAKYFGWNFGERMISRARYGIERIKDDLKYEWLYEDACNVRRLSTLFDVNFDMKDVLISADIIAEHREEFPEENFNEYVFLMQQNNDGKLFVDINAGVVKYAFLDDDANLDHIMDATAYIRWNLGEDWTESKHLSKSAIRTCERNIKYIEANAVLMTKEEMEEFITFDYQNPK